MVNRIKLAGTALGIGTLRLFLWAGIAFGLFSGAARANPDVYAALPGDTRVLQYSVSDLDGDSSAELAVLYTSGGATMLTLFKARSGSWVRWWDDNGALADEDGTFPSRLETADTNGNGVSEILTYTVTGDRSAMTARIWSFDETSGQEPDFKVILEDMTAPPGYPLLGSQDSKASVTFLKMPSPEEDGYRRVYCWNGESFENCLEVEWEKP